MTDAGVLAAADAVLHPVRAVAGFEEGRLPGGGVGGDQLVAPPVGLLQQRKLRPGTGAFPAADDPHVGLPVRQQVTVDRPAQQAGELDHPGVIEVTGLSLGVGHRLPGRLGYPGDGGSGPLVEVESD